MEWIFYGVFYRERFTRVNKEKNHQEILTAKTATFSKCIDAQPFRFNLLQEALIRISEHFINTILGCNNQRDFNSLSNWKCNFGIIPFTRSNVGQPVTIMNFSFHFCQRYRVAVYKFKLIDESRYDAHLIQRQNRGLRIFPKYLYKQTLFY